MNKISEIRGYVPKFPFLKYLQAIDPSFVTITKPYAIR